MSETTPKTEAIRARIRALLARTTERGCTEAEAETAATMAARLLDEYGFALEDLHEREDIVQETWKADGKRPGAVVYVTNAISEYCDCRVWRTNVGGGQQGIRFLGRQSDAEVASYLTDLIAHALETQWQSYRRENFISGRDMSERASFLLGMTHRLSARLREMKAERNRAVDAGGRTAGALVVVKSAEVDAAFAKLQMKLRHSRSTTRAVNGGAFSAGRAAANRVALNPAIGRGVGRIGA